MTVTASRRNTPWRRQVGAAILLASACCAALAAGAGYQSFVVGDRADSVASPLPQQPSTVLMGGGADVGAAFRWMIEQAGGGDFLVLRATGTDAYNRYIYRMGGVDSVQTLIVQTRKAAADPTVVEAVDKAEAIFIASGDQRDYVQLWQGTPLADAINRAAARNVPVGGTSAGLAVLGQHAFGALHGTVESNEALADPYGRRMTLVRDFLSVPGLQNTIADSHFGARDRMGRLLTFLARTVQDGWSPLADARAIGVDENTALLVHDGVGQRVGSGSVYFLRPTAPPAVCRAGKPLRLQDVAVQRLSRKGSFDLAQWLSPDGGTASYELSVDHGDIASTQPGRGIY